MLFIISKQIVKIKAGQYEMLFYTMQEIVNVMPSC